MRSFLAKNPHSSIENKCVYFGLFLLLQYILVSSSSQEKPLPQEKD